VLGSDWVADFERGRGVEQESEGRERREMRRRFAGWLAAKSSQAKVLQ